jgi:N-acetylglutamate synthase-like GNAT family acetyltransferase
MNDLILVKHAKGAPGLRLLGIGPGFRPLKGITQLSELFQKNTSWAQNRSNQEIRKMLSNSKVIVSAWHQNTLVGFGRATTDEIFRAVLWDIVVDKKYEHHGIGKKIISSILENQYISVVERIYIMTTHCENFYLKMNFQLENNQKLMIIKKKD